MKCQAQDSKTKQNKQEKHLTALWTGFYNMKKVTVVSLAHDTPTGPLFIPTKYESNPLKNKGDI